MKTRNILAGAAFILLGGLCSCGSDMDAAAPALPSGGITIAASCNDMLPQTPLTRADDPTPKNAEEKRIRTLHLFFFDADGNFLVPTNSDTFSAYYRLEVPEGQPAALSISDNTFVDQENLTGVQVYAVANVYGNRFRTRWTPEGDIVNGDSKDPGKEVTVERLQNLRDWLYRPTPREDISLLPEPGMPMVGLTAGVNLSLPNQTVQIEMRALMARVDVSVRLDASQTNHDRSLPTLEILSYGVRNMPYFVPFTPPAEAAADATLTEVTEIPADNPDGTNDFIARERVVPYRGRILHDQQTAATFSYYTYENVQRPDPVKYAPYEDGSGYPDGVEADDESAIQRWKPTFADRNASSLVLKGIYVTHQELTYQADFNIYMGKNTYNNFEVRRNCCYKNNITICGLDYVHNEDEHVYTFDGRVNVVTENPLYIAIVNERKLDAHWNVVPMDLYFLRRESGTVDLESYVDVSLVDPATGRAPDWIRMELVDSMTMLRGKTGDDFIAGGDFEAGTGARKYFYTNLVTETLRDNTAIRVSGPEHRSRSRIYFYVDENASTQDRSATVYITYNNRLGDRRPRTLELDQKGLLLVEGTDHGADMPFYIEYYEEYIDHRDPLDRHKQDNTYYDGLPWAREGAYLATNVVIGQSNAVGVWNPFNPCNVYNNGLQMTRYVFNDRAADVASMNTMMTYPEGIPASAFHYCYAKNRRNPDGSYEENWYLPGISEVEAAIAKYYPTFEEFQNNYYWSSAAAKDPNHSIILARENENATYARATMYFPPERIPAGESQGNPWVQSGSKGPGDNYTGGGNKAKGGNHGEYRSGRAPKTVPFRIRACRRAEGVTP